MHGENIFLSYTLILYEEYVIILRAKKSFTDERGKDAMHEKIIGASLPSSAALAYLGDAWYSLYVRRRLIEAGIEKAARLNEAALTYVTAARQAERMRKILPLLSEDEREVFSRAANASHPHRPKGATAADYRYATGFEALLGMLCFVKDEERLLYLMAEAHTEEDSINDSEN